MKTASTAILKSGLFTIIFCTTQACAADKEEHLRTAKKFIRTIA